MEPDLADASLGRFQVRGRVTDKELIRNVAERLVADDAEADLLRAELARRVGGGRQRPAGGILAALRRSPLVGADLDLSREQTLGRDAGL